MNDPVMHRELRERFLETLRQEGAAALVAGGRAPMRNADCEYPFRPHSDFFYLTGFDEPDCVLLLLPTSEEHRSVLFLRERNPDDEVWTGRRLGVERAVETLGVDAAFDVDELWSELPELLKGVRRLVHRLGEDEDRDRELLRVIKDLRDGARRGTQVPTELVDPSQNLHEQRLFKSEAELDHMRRAAAITAEAHLAAMREAEPGRGEREIEALLSYTFRRNGGTGAAYESIVAGGENACILHYTDNDATLAAGELLLIDAGAEWSYYASDVTRTFPVSGTFSDDQRALYEVVLRAQKAAIDATRPGVSFHHVHDVATRELVEGLVTLGLLEGEPEALIEDGAHRRFTLHSTSHWLGLDVHDCGAYWVDGESRPLEPGMVLTIEPGLYVPGDDEDVDARWRGIGIRIEDDVLVTAEGHEVLTAAVPKEVDAVEAACQGRALQPA